MTVFCKMLIKRSSDNDVLIGAGYYCDFEEGEVQKGNNTKLVTLKLKFG